MSTWMLYACVVAVLLAAAAWLLERALGRLAVASRWIWAASLVASCTLPLLRLGPARSTAAPLAFVVEPAPLSDPAPRRPTALEAPSRRWLPSALATLSPSTPSLPGGLDSFALAFWALLTLGVGGLGARAFVRLQKLRSGWRTERMEGRDVWLSEDVGPAVVGILRPTIVVPRWVVGLPPEDRDLLLRHEEEHRRAGDLRLLAMALSLLALLPWNPALWWQMGRLRAAVELDCDRRVVRGRSELRRYALLLVEMGRRRTVAGLGALAFANPVPLLERRILALVAAPRPGAVRTAALAVMALCLAAAARQVGPSAPDDAVDPSGQVAPPAPSDLAGRISGRVSDAATGGPVADVQIYLVGANRGSVSRQNGVYLILDVPAGTYELRAERAGVEPLSLEVTVADDEVLTVDLTMTVLAPSPEAARAAPPATPGRIAGRVTGGDGAPLADVQVYLVGASLGSLSRQNGAYLILNVPAGTYQIRAERVGLSPVTHDVTIGESGTVTVDFVMGVESFALESQVPPRSVSSSPRPAVESPRASDVARISGRVTEAATGAPLADVQIYLAGASLGSLSRRNGVYLILNVVPGTYDLVAERVGLTTAVRRITVRAGDSAEVDFTLSPQTVPLVAAVGSDG